jgi:fermentation-respiration switch protein FrsA (DUF1100 family)
MSIFEFPVIVPSGGASLVGRVHRNVDNLVDPQPTIMVTGSWLTVKEQMPRTYALALGELGYTVFTFDFSGFGESGGTPRQLELPLRKIEDIRAAADFLSTSSFVQGGAAGHLGICASAQYALAAIARGAKIRSYASVAGWYHDTASVAGFYGGVEGVAQRLQRARAAHDSFATNGTVVTVPAYRVGDERAGMWFELDYYADPRRGVVPEWKNEMAEMSWLYWLTFDGLRAARDVSVPTVMVHGDGCVLPDNARGVYAALRGPKQLEWVAGNQIDFYDQPLQVTQSVAIVDRHFRATLGGGAA